MRPHFPADPARQMGGRLKSRGGTIRGICISYRRGCMMDSLYFYARRQQSLHEVAHAGDGHLGITQGLGLGLLAAGHLLGQLQQLVPRLLDGLGTIDDGEASTSMLSTILA